MPRILLRSPLSAILPLLGSAPLVLLAPARANAPGPLGAWSSLALEDGSSTVATAVFSPARAGRLLLAGSWGGVFRSDDFGDSWTAASAGLPRDVPFHLLAASPADEDVFYAASWTRGIHRTTDAGTSWSPLPDPPFGPQIAALLPDAADVQRVRAAIHLGTARGVWTSTDGGASWASTSDGLGGAAAHALAAHPLDPSTLLVGTAAGIARSTDGGASWGSVHAGNAVRELEWHAASPSRVRARPEGPGLLESTDAGATWQPFTARSAASFASNPLDPSELFVATSYQGCNFPGYAYVGHVQRSTNAGASWAEVQVGGCRITSPAFLEVDPADAERVYMAWSGQSFLRSDTGGAPGSFTSRSDGLRMTRVRHVRVGAGDRWFVRPTWISGVFASVDGGASWDLRTLAGHYRYEAAAFDVSRTVPDVLHEGGEEWCDPGPWCDVPVYFGSRSTDGGGSWDPEVYLPSGKWFEPTLIVSGGPGALAVYAWDRKPELYRSNDGWATLGYVRRTFRATAAVVDPVDSSRLFATTEGVDPVRLSTDGGVTWTPRAVGLPRNDLPVRILMAPDDPDRLLVAFMYRGAWESTDAGGSWTPVRIPLAGWSAEPAGTPTRREVPLPLLRDADWDVAAGGRRVFLATNHGVLIEGYGFVNEGLGSLATTSIAYSPARRKLIVGTERLGAWILDVPAPREPARAAARATLPDEAGAPVVSAAGLEVWPNPFRDAVSIRFVAPRSGATVRLEVFDAAGRRTRTILDGPAGVHDVIWDGRDDRGRRVSPGVYFLRLDAGGERRTARIVKGG